MKNDGEEIVLTGLGVSHGIAAGPAYLVQIEHPQPPDAALEPEQTETEIARFDDAVRQAQRELAALKRKSTGLPDDAAEEIGLLLDAHMAMLSGSRLIRGVRARILRDQVNAESAIRREIDSIAGQFNRIKDAYIAARGEDVRNVGYRIIRILMNVPYLSLDDVPPGGIVLALEISPAETALLDPRRFAGIATVYGGPAGHTAVMARSLGLPAVLGLDRAALESLHHGTPSIVDGIGGKLVLNPSQATQRHYERRMQDLKADKAALDKLTRLPAVTTDGAEIVLRANLEIPREIDNLPACGADGIGLFRTEFMFMNRDTIPAEDEQFEILVEIVRAMKGAPVTFRTLDIGGDKLARALGAHLDASDNPALGLRAIRLSLKEPHLLEAQFRAIMRAGYFGPVRILLPMVTTAAEIEDARLILQKCHAALEKEKVPMAAQMPPLGAMIEIPAAALSADSLAAVSDFFALGTNDLIQYTVAIDRGNDQVAALYNPLNPAVLRLMEFSIQAGLRAGIPVSICGEMAADPKLTALLLGLGIREMSLGAASLPRIKQRIRSLALAHAESHAKYVMDQYDPDRIAQIVNSFKTQ
ncbi:MAG: phosphoenolpyruvate--protein phosphotransferase [Alphaproteobacteria bacterium]|nr:phosphoenolpyruvate--protein phosphotransferase [Alphaproteobacteria bacterium]